MITVGITLGDITGIGPEVALKALARVLGDEDSTSYVLIGDADAAEYYSGLLGVAEPLPAWAMRAEVPGRLYLLSPEDSLPTDLTPGHPTAALAAMASLRIGTEQCLAGTLAALVTAPVSKEAILRAGQPFVGQTEFLAALSGCSRFAMMLLGHDESGRWLRVALATTHLPLKDVAMALRSAAIQQTIELTAEACRQLGLPRARIGVCGLNPHAGEGGLLGREEIDLIAPAVAAAQALGLEVRGPAAADTLFQQAFRGDYDAVVAMYHDQGLVPLKMVAFATGVNWTLGLPFIRTSPDHGTAYDLAGQGRADESSMVSAIRLARQLARERAVVRS